MSGSNSPTYALTTIDVPGAPDTIPLAIDQEGDIAGYVELDQTGDNIKGFHDIGGTITEDDPNGFNTMITALSENGWIAGDATADSGAGKEGFVANIDDNASVQIFFEKAQGLTPFVTGVDQAGDAVGYSKTNAGVKTGFVFTNTSALTNQLLAPNPPSVTGTSTAVVLQGTADVTASEVNAISENGEFIGGDFTDKSGQHAFVYDLLNNNLETMGDIGSSVAAVNNLGQAAGNLNSFGSLNAPLFFFDGKKITNLLNPSGSDLFGSVSGMNNKGQVVGFDSGDQAAGGAGPTAFVYTGGQLSLIDGPSSNGTSSFIAPEGINDSGEITGFYTLSGTHGFTATPSQPPTLNLAITAPPGRSADPLTEGDTVTATISETAVSGASYTFTEVNSEGDVVTVLQAASGSPAYTLGYNLSGGDAIAVSASFTDSGGAEIATADTGPLGTADAPEAGTLTLSGLTDDNAVVGTPIVATIADPNGNPATATYTFTDLKSGVATGTVLASGPSDTLTPTAEEIGDTITVMADYTDAQGFEDKPTASAGIVVAAPPGGTSTGSSPVIGIPTANAQTSTTAETIPDPILLTGTDPDSPALPLTFAITAQPTGGTLSGFDAATGAVTYTPNAGTVGADSFAFTDTNGTNTSAPATVTIAVTAPPGPSVVSPPPAPIAVTAPPTNNAVTPTLAFDRSVSVSGNLITLSGTTTPGSAVEVFANMGAAQHVDLGAAAVDPTTGAWTLASDEFTRGFHNGIMASATLGGVTTTTDSGLDLTTGLGPNHLGFTTILDDYDTATDNFLGSTFIKGGGGIFAKDHHTDLPDGGERYTYTGGSILADQSVSSFSASYIDGNLTGSILHNDDGTTTIENDAKYQVVNSHHDDTIVDYGSHTRFIFHDGAGHEAISGFKLDSDTISVPAADAAHLAKAIQVYDPATNGFDTTVFTGQGFSITFMGIRKEQLLAHAADIRVHA